MPSRLSFRRGKTDNQLSPKKSNVLARDVDDLQTRLKARLERMEQRLERNDTPLYIPTGAAEMEHFYIEDKAGRTIPLPLMPHQINIIQSVNADIQQRKPCRIILLKPRQSYGSTTFAYITYFLVTRLNLKATIIGHKEVSSQNLYEMVKTFYSHDPYFRKGEISPDKANDKIIRFPGGGRILIATAGSKDALTSTTNQIIHATEVALWPGDAGAQMRGLLNTVSDTHPLTFVFIESTARPGGEYQNRWYEAKRGKSSYKPIFIPWMDIQEYHTPIFNPADRDKIVNSYSEDETRLATTYSASPEQILWRRQTLADKCRGVTYEAKLIDFNSEYPEDDVVAFSSSEAAVFDTSKVNKMIEEAGSNAPQWIGEMMNRTIGGVRWMDLNSNEALRKQIFRSYHNGSMRIWEYPQPNTQYVLGADVAEGIEVGDYARDNSAITIRRQDNGATALTWAGKIAPDDFADMIQCVGLFYNIAYCCVENNNMGITTNLRLWKQYPKYAIYKSKYGMDRAEKDRVGFQTTGTSKNPAIMDLSMALKNDEFKTYDMDLLHQLLECVQDAKGKIATQGKDKLMATVMSEVARLDNINYNLPPVEINQTPYDVWTKWRREEKELSDLQQYSVSAFESFL